MFYVGRYMLFVVTQSCTNINKNCRYQQILWYSWGIKVILQNSTYEMWFKHNICFKKHESWIFILLFLVAIINYSEGKNCFINYNMYINFTFTNI